MQFLNPWQLVSRFRVELVGFASAASDKNFFAIGREGDLIRGRQAVALFKRTQS